MVAGALVVEPIGLLTTTRNSSPDIAAVAPVTVRVAVRVPLSPPPSVTFIQALEPGASSCHW